MMSSLLLLGILLAPTQAPTPTPASTDAGGQVQIPLDVYERLLEASRNIRRGAPAGYALGTARVNVRVEDGAAMTAEIRVELSLDVLENEWVLVPVLPIGAAVESVTVSGQVAQLLPTPRGLAWSTNVKGSYTMGLVYRVDATASRGGYTLALPLPEAAAIQLDASLPGTGLDATVLPGAGVRVTDAGGRTRVQASVPTAAGVQLSWRLPTESRYVVSRASYTGRLEGERLAIRGDLGVDLFADEAVAIPLFPTGVTLVELRVDGEPATILVEGGRFAALVRGRGAHRISADLRVAVSRESGPPSATLDIPAIPVSSFELSFPGRKDVNVMPGGNAVRRFRNGTTVATANVPMSPKVTFSWSEAVPEDVRAELRWNATLYHLLHAEEGVLFGRVIAQFEVSRGQTNVLELGVPADVQVNRVTAQSGAVADWKVEAGTLRVFLDRELRGELVLEVELDRSLTTETALAAPLFTAVGPQRQKGMMALLSTRDLALFPSGEIDESRLTRVGENQLPAFVREGISRTVAHTFKYVESPPDLSIVASPPELAQGKFDANVDTLLSVGEASLRGTASVEVQVKSGRLMGLSISLPSGLNLLGVTAPSLREQTVVPDADGSGTDRLNLDFTQEMEGAFRIEIGYEQVLGAVELSAALPRLTVVGAEIERGRIAVEALSAVEVRASDTSGLTALDVRELPRQLVLRTTNPILMAYKYAQAEPPYRLELALTRHEVAEVQEATIDEAIYRTLVTEDGLSVTTSRFEVRNSRKQFLKVVLPPSSEVWSALVDGRSEKPAVSGENAVLLPIPSSEESFEVELIYATRGARFASVGRAAATLARPDILATRSRWDVYLPSDYEYGSPRSSLKLVALGDVVTAEEMKRELEDASAGSHANAPPVIRVPALGVRFGFEDLYANQNDEEAWFSISYRTGSGAFLARMLSAAAVGLVWLGASMLRSAESKASRRLSLAVAFAGVAGLGIVLFRYEIGAGTALLAALVAAAIIHRDRLLSRFRAHTPSELPTPPLAE